MEELFLTLLAGLPDCLHCDDGFLSCGPCVLTLPSIIPLFCFLSYFLDLFIYFMCLLCLLVYTCVPGTHGSQKKASGPQELESWIMVRWHVSAENQIFLATKPLHQSLPSLWSMMLSWVRIAFPHCWTVLSDNMVIHSPMHWVCMYVKVDSVSSVGWGRGCSSLGSGDTSGCEPPTCMLGTGFRSSGRAANAPHCWASSPVPTNGPLGYIEILWIVNNRNTGSVFSLLCLE